MEATRRKNPAVLLPQVTADAVKAWWRPDTRSGMGYHCHRVQALGRKISEHQDLLTFAFVGDAEVWTVDLEDTASVWPEPPSTAQLARNGQFGFLLLATGWTELPSPAQHGPSLAEVGLRLPELEATRVREEANLTPRDRPEDLKRWWAPDTAGGGGYLAFKVQVLGRAGNLLNFRLVEGNANSFTVDLDLQTTLVWPELPSTAPRAAPGEFGVLLLSRKWARLNSVPEACAGSGGEWPPGPEWE
ncbi:MAG: hypothetical protein M3Y59_19885 [Myxococcota bacterium]|nr:hypothetical protein [Myxococcota bacterium]